MQFFSFFISSNFEFSLMNALVYVDIDRGIHKGKLKNALNEKLKKLHGFSLSINIANFEAFRWTKKLISNLFFLKSDRFTANILHSNRRDHHLLCLYYLQYIWGPIITNSSIVTVTYLSSNMEIFQFYPHLLIHMCKGADRG